MEFCLTSQILHELKMDNLKDELIEKNPALPNHASKGFSHPPVTFR